MMTATPGAFARALAERKRRIRKRRIWIVSITAPLIVLVGFGFYAFFFSPWLVVKHVEVEAGPLLSVERVREVAAIALEEPLARVEVSAVTARLEALIEAAEVSVRREFPDTVAIRITEREAVYERDVDDGYQWIDFEGVAFHTATERDESKLLADIDSDDQRLLRDVATVVRWIPPDVRLEVTGVQAPAVDGITLSLTDGREVIWGSAADSELKSEVLGTLMQVEASVYDVSAPMYPTTR